MYKFKSVKKQKKNKVKIVFTTLRSEKRYTGRKTEIENERYEGGRLHLLQKGLFTNRKLIPDQMWHVSNDRNSEQCA